MARIDASPGAVQVYSCGSSSASAATNPDVTTDTLIPNMSVAFTLAASATVQIQVFTSAAKSAGMSRIRVYDGSTVLAPLGQGTWGFYSYQAGENNANQASFQFVTTLAAGSHTIAAKWQASTNTNSITWYDRWMTITVIG